VQTFFVKKVVSPNKLKTKVEVGKVYVDRLRILFLKMFISKTGKNTLLSGGKIEANQIYETDL
jgi:hypothetical protein